MSNDTTKASEIVFSPRLLAVLAAINPVLLLAVGFVLNRGIDSAKLKIEQNQAQIQDLKTAAETSSINARIQVDKVKVIQDFLHDLPEIDGFHLFHDYSFVTFSTRRSKPLGCRLKPFTLARVATTWTSWSTKSHGASSTMRRCALR
jgi:hypothetical protein